MLTIASVAATCSVVIRRIIKVGPYFALFPVRESHKDVGVPPRFQLHRLIQGRKQRRATPVVQHSISIRHAIEVCSYNDHPVGTPRQHVNNVRQLWTPSPPVRKGVVHRNPLPQTFA